MIRARSQTTFVNFAIYWPPTYSMSPIKSTYFSVLLQNWKFNGTFWFRLESEDLCNHVLYSVSVWRFLFGHGYHAPLEFTDFNQHFLELQILSSGQLTKFVVPKSVDRNQKIPGEHDNHAQIKKRHTETE